MINLGTYETLTHRLFNGVNRVNRLEALLAKLNEFQDLIFSEETRGDVEYKTKCLIEGEFGDMLEELTAQVETAISLNKRNVDNCNIELRQRIFLTENGKIRFSVG